MDLVRPRARATAIRWSALSLVAGAVLAMPGRWVYGPVAVALAVDVNRLALAIGAGTSIVVAAVVAGLTGRIRRGLLVGLLVGVPSVILATGAMILAESPPTGLAWRTDLGRAAGNVAAVTAALGWACCLAVLVGVAAAAEIREVRRPRRRGRALLLALTILVAALGIAIVPPARAIANYGPADRVHHLVAARSAGRHPHLATPSNDCGAGPSRVESRIVPSPALGEPRPLLFAVPAGYPRCAPPGGYPVLVLLHGDPGDRGYWIRMGSQELLDADFAAGGEPIVAVYPEGTAAVWTDWADGGRPGNPWRMGTFLGVDLPAYLDRQPALARGATRRFIGGFSSGGFGSASIALAYPAAYGGFLSIDGYFGIHDPESTAVGLSEASSPRALARKLDPNSVRALVAAGTEDGHFYTVARAFDSEIAGRGWNPVFVSAPGGHSVELWRSLLWKSLPALQAWIAAAPERRGI